MSHLLHVIKVVFFYQFQISVWIKVLHFTIRDKFVRTCNSKKRKNKENCDTKKFVGKRKLKNKNYCYCKQNSKDIVVEIGYFCESIYLIFHLINTLFHFL